MPPTRGPLWEFFHRGRKRNTAHCNAYCLACIALYRPDNVPIPIDPARVDRCCTGSLGRRGWRRTSTVGNHDGAINYQISSSYIGENSLVVNQAPFQGGSTSFHEGNIAHGAVGCRALRRRVR
ncbi:hypothetical protein B0H14DRAFT_3863131 [Mycena olivaceomarginata]|nr:hypothetical protein B0H14DRAFT_3863131 [Mycena olivaceomarginata]